MSRAKALNPNRARNMARNELRKGRAAQKWAARRRAGKAVERGAARHKRRHP